MDSRQWHKQAHQCTSAMPVPWEPARVQESPQDQLEAYAAEVRSALRAQRLRSPAHEAIAASLTNALTHAESEPPGARTILSLSAPYAIGKSSLIKDWAQHLYREWTTGSRVVDLPEWQPEAGVNADLVPVIYVSVLARSNSRDLYSTILEFLGYPGRGTARDATLLTTRALKAHGVRLLIVDDAHMLNTSRVTGRATLDALKQLNTELGELGGSLILVGANLRGGAALSDPQIRGRLLEHDLTPYTLQSPSDIGQWQSLMANARSLLVDYLPDLGIEPMIDELAKAAYRRTQGWVGDVSTLLAGATEATIMRRGTTLTIDDLHDVRLSQRAHDGEAAYAMGARKPKAEAS